MFNRKTILRVRFLFRLALTAMILGAGAMACQKKEEDPMKNAEKKLGEAADEAGKAVDKAADAAKDALDKIGGK